MLRLTVSAEEYLLIGEDVKIIFLGGSKNHLRIMIDAPKELNVVRNKVLESQITDPAEKEKLPHYYAVPDLPERFRKKKIVMNDSAKGSAAVVPLNRKSGQKQLPDACMNHR